MFRAIDSSLRVASVQDTSNKRSSTARRGAYGLLNLHPKPPACASLRSLTQIKSTQRHERAAGIQIRRQIRADGVVRAGLQGWAC
eukprot:1182643-Prorocentrum_minimum.AAC.2